MPFPARGLSRAQCRNHRVNWRARPPTAATGCTDSSTADANDSCPEKVSRESANLNCPAWGGAHMEELRIDAPFPLADHIHDEWYPGTVLP